MLITGVIIGPYLLNLIALTVLTISSDLRRMALIIILTKAGLSIKLSDLKKIGRPAILLSFLPACFEIIAYLIFAPLLIEVNIIEASLIGAIIAAVSPAVIIPKMGQLIEEGYGIEKRIPHLIMIGSSCDDIFVIVLFTTFLGIASGENNSFSNFINVPISIILGLSVGILSGYLVSVYFKYMNKKSKSIKNSKKVIIIIGLSFFYAGLEVYLENIFSFSSLVAIVSMAFMIGMYLTSSSRNNLINKFNKIWVAFEILLFVLVGACIDLNYLFNVGFYPIILIVIGLVFKSIGVLLSLVKTNFSIKEKIFCIIFYLPKATVQAAIGTIPLAVGLPCGEIVLSIAILSIIITAPLGALGIDYSYKHLLKNDLDRVN